MIAVIQRTSSASVAIAGDLNAEIGMGLLVLVGITTEDTVDDGQWLASTIVNLRIFGDEQGVMNLNVKELRYDIIVVSQFTLHASTKKGNRPSYINAAKPDIAIPLYHQFIADVENALGKSVQTGQFGADMKVSLVNDGPVTIIIDTKNRV